MEGEWVEGYGEEGLDGRRCGVDGGRGDEDELAGAGVRVVVEVVEPEDGAEGVADDDGRSGDGIECIVEGGEPVGETGVCGVWQDREVDAVARGGEGGGEPVLPVAGRGAVPAVDDDDVGDVGLGGRDHVMVSRGVSERLPQSVQLPS